MMADAIRLQELQAVEYAHQNGLMPVQVFSDAGFSGNTMKRPAFQKMLQQIETGNVSDVVVCSLSRLSRNMLCANRLFENALVRHGVSLHSVKEGCNIQRMLAPFSSLIEKGGWR
ncbi:recombinase family protein [Oscillibacter sp. MSJ-31]|nr:recombinase family protein [Oscillibacter sp. MSJ-31]